MSPRFGLALLLLCFVLLGLSDAQRQQQRQQQQKITPRQGQHTQGSTVANGNSARRGLGRASGRSTPEVAPATGTTCQVDSTTTSPGADAGPAPEIASGSDGNMNTLAGNNHDRFKKRNLKVVVNARNTAKNVV